MVNSTRDEVVRPLGAALARLRTVHAVRRRRAPWVVLAIDECEPVCGYVPAAELVYRRYVGLSRDGEVFTGWISLSENADGQIENVKGGCCINRHDDEGDSASV
jgi:hypothetical protein